MAGKPKNKQFGTYLMLALRDGADSDDDLPHLRAIAEALVKVAKSGKIDAIKEVADRIDGKVPQAIVGDDDHPPVAVVERRIVRAEG